MVLDMKVIPISMNFNILSKTDSSISDSFLFDEPVVVNWSNGRYFESLRNYLWISDMKEHTIKMITDKSKKIPLNPFRGSCNCCWSN